jgi:putative FmdB family regulatory protein
MPIYEFECSACSHAYERLQKLSDPDPIACPSCGRETVKRRLSAPSFRLAGGGWYETDFKGDKDKKRNLAGGEDAPKPAGGDTATKSAESKTTETKPATTASASTATPSN